MKAAMDAELSVTKSGDIRTLKVTKMRDGSDNLSCGFKLEPVHVSDDEITGEPILVPAVAPVGLPRARTPSDVKPSTFPGVVLESLSRAFFNFYFDDELRVTIDDLLMFVPEVHAEVKGEQVPKRWRDSAMRALKDLHAQGILRKDGNRVSSARVLNPFN